MLDQEAADRELLKGGKSRTHGGAFVMSCIVLQPAVPQKTSVEMKHTMLQRYVQCRKNKEKKTLHHSVSRLLVAAATHR